jgi:hypothetical protein
MTHYIKFGASLLAKCTSALVRKCISALVHCDETILYSVRSFADIQEVLLP